MTCNKELLSSSTEDEGATKKKPKGLFRGKRKCYDKIRNMFINI